IRWSRNRPQVCYSMHEESTLLRGIRKRTGFMPGRFSEDLTHCTEFNADEAVTPLSGPGTRSLGSFRHYYDASKQHKYGSCRQ
ncbi:MAG: hypothetical protein WBO24_04545, partial [Nitrospirales bacterium]